jgi:hypothetical protein
VTREAVFSVNGRELRNGLAAHREIIEIPSHQLATIIKGYLVFGLEVRLLNFDSIAISQRCLNFVEKLLGTPSPLGHSIVVNMH